MPPNALQNRVPRIEPGTKEGRFLVADIGGTNTRIAMTQNGHIISTSIRRFKNAQAGSFEHILRGYIAEHKQPKIDAACVAIAGPMLGDVVDVTNLGWQVDATKVGRIVGVKKAKLLNDLEALGYCLDDLPAPSQKPIFAGKRIVQPELTRLVVGLGTGFNTAVVHRDPRGVLSVNASETGHMGMPVRSQDDLSLFRFAGHSGGYCSIEDILSGRGLEAVYAWISTQSGTEDRKTSAEITATLSVGNNDLENRTMQVYTAILGNVLSDLTLAYLPLGGIFLAGGVARHLTPFFQHFDLHSAYTDKGRKSDWMRDFSLTLIEDDYAALLGCAVYLRQKPLVS